MDNSAYSTKIPDKPSPDKIDVPKAIDSTPRREKDPEPGPQDSPSGVEYFGIDYWPEIILNPQLDVYKTVEKVLYIEEFINNRIRDEGLKADKESYLKVVKSMEDELGLTPQHESYLRVDKIFNLLNLMKKSSYDKEKKRIISLLKTNK